MPSNNKIEGFELNEFEVIEEIVFLDQPILTHLKRNDRDYFQYLVESKSESDILIIFEVSQSDILKYLSKDLSLYDIINDNPNLIIEIEQSFSGEILKSRVVTSKSLNENFLPYEDSYIQYSPTIDSKYYSLLDEYRSNEYLKGLRNRAFYVKFSNANPKYSNTIGFRELAGSLLKDLNLSFKNFLEIDFNNQFKSLFTDTKKLKSVFSRIKPELDYRVVDLKYSSFEIGLSIDHLHKLKIKDLKVKDWAIEIGSKFKNEVLSSDFSSHDVEEIVQKYSPGSRKKIFAPYFRIIENEDYKFQLKSNSSTKYKRIELKNKELKEKVIPKHSKVKDIATDFELIQVTALRDKKTKGKTIRIDENTLFEEIKEKHFNLNEQDFRKNGFEIQLDEPINGKISIIGKKVFLVANYAGEEYTKEVEDNKINDAKNELIFEIANAIEK